MALTAAPRPYRVTLSRPAPQGPTQLDLMALSAADALLSAQELAGSDAKPVRVTQQGEWE